MDNSIIELSKALRNAKTGAVEECTRDSMLITRCTGMARSIMLVEECTKASGETTRCTGQALSHLDRIALLELDGSG
jgi:hypothetical protein